MDNLTERLSATAFARLLEYVRGGHLPCSAFGVCDGARPFLLRSLRENTGRTVIYVAQNDYLALSMHAAIEDSAYFPSVEKQISLKVVSSKERLFARAAALSSDTGIVTTSINAFLEYLSPKEDYDSCVLHLKTGEVDIEEMVSRLLQVGYERVPTVEVAGQFARRGDILDVFCAQGEAYRLSFAWDNLERITKLDPATQRSLESVEKLTAHPASFPLSASGREKAAAFFEKQLRDANRRFELSVLAGYYERYLDIVKSGGTDDALYPFIFAIYPKARLIDYYQAPLVVFDNLTSLDASNNAFLQQYITLIERIAKENLSNVKFELFAGLEETLGGSAIDLCGVKRFPALKSVSEMNAATRSVVKYQNRLDLLKDDIALRKKAGFEVFALCKNASRVTALQNLGIEYIVPLAGDGFEATEAKLLILGEGDIFLGKKTSAKKGRDILDISELKVGDVVVHETHGKARFLGVSQQTVAGKTRDYLILEYLGGDKLFIPTEQIERVQKYSGSESPRLSKLGTKEWDNQKTAAKASIKQLAHDLLMTYTERKSVKGHAFAPDTVWQKEFEDAFEYDETPGQLSSIEEIKADMESDGIMDRLLLGDVGYGKTEVAARACFKAVMDGKQCAVLTPTTLLARQHFETFSKRFERFGLNVVCLSRFISAKQMKENLIKISSGEANIIIGTHRMLSSDVQFADLGLLVIDEEQRFGVTHKEKIKKLKKTVDVLTMSATPIPRTMEMSLTGIRDLSTIDTPIEQRLPVETYVLEFSPQMLLDAITKEKLRGGQCYIVVRHISQMEKLERIIADMPGISMLSAHGQMNREIIENTMEKFTRGEADVLLSTTIIESGIDIPSVNTIVVYEADKFGLSQLYQLRGRVGRSNVRAYAYFTYINDDTMTQEAASRLATIREFTELGAGFKIALRDLKIRGAGNLLGSEQSGHMDNVGYELYLQYMKEAVAELKGEQYTSPKETTVEINIDAHIPASYMEDAQRIEMYKRIAAVRTKSEAEELLSEMKDRYGEPPQSVKNLIMIALMRTLAASAGVEAIIERARGYELRYTSNVKPDIVKLMGNPTYAKNVNVVRGQNALLFKPERRSVKTFIDFLNYIRCITEKITV